MSFVGLPFELETAVMVNLQINDICSMRVVNKERNTRASSDFVWRSIAERLGIAVVPHSDIMNSLKKISSQVSQAFEGTYVGRVNGLLANPKIHHLVELQLWHIVKIFDDVYDEIAKWTFPNNSLDDDNVAQLAFQSTSNLLGRDDTLGDVQAKIDRLHDQHFSNCQRIFFPNRSLTFLPPTFDRFAHLISLNLRGNLFATIPSVIGRVTTLKYLDLGKNQITTVGHELESLSELKELSLDQNEICDVLLKVEKLRSLKVLNLNDNHLTSIPPQLNKLVQDQRCSMDHQIDSLTNDLDALELE